MSWITIYDRDGNDHYLNTEHVVSVVRYEQYVNLFTTQARLVVMGTPNCPDGPLDDLHQDVIDQIGGKA